MLLNSCEMRTSVSEAVLKRNFLLVVFDFFFVEQHASESTVQPREATCDMNVVQLSTEATYAYPVPNAWGITSDGATSRGSSDD